MHFQNYRCGSFETCVGKSDIGFALQHYRNYFSHYKNLTDFARFGKGCNTVRRILRGEKPFGTIFNFQAAVRFSPAGVSNLCLICKYIRPPAYPFLGRQGALLLQYRLSIRVRRLGFGFKFLSLICFDPLILVFNFIIPFSPMRIKTHMLIAYRCTNLFSFSNIRLRFGCPFCFKMTDFGVLRGFGILM